MMNTGTLIADCIDLASLFKLGIMLTVIAFARRMENLIGGFVRRGVDVVQFSPSSTYCTIVYSHS